MRSTADEPRGTRKLPPQERSQIARMGGLARAARYDSTAMTAAARKRFEARFEIEVDPQGVLPPPERQKRARAARQLYFLRLSRAGQQARRRKAGG